jgi:ubiquinone/menaquinone biosynthesis C-methylase UbiE
MECQQLLKTEKAQIENEVIYLSDPEKFKKQEQLYLDVRKKEERLYSDEIVKILPELDSVHPLYHEWQIRKKSLQRYLSYLKKRKALLKILDLGCGNGWMSNQLAENLKCSVYALDMNTVELQQGARLFGRNPHLNFQYGNIFDLIYPDQQFDIVLLVSSVQYFPDVQKLIARLFELLSRNGEIHIFDSPIYQSHEVSAARERTNRYYQQIGFPEMADHYFHHSMTDLNKFDLKVMYDPNSLFQRIAKILIKYSAPFPWIQIEKSEQD